MAPKIEKNTSKQHKRKQAGAEQCQAQKKLGLARNCGLFPLIKELRLSSNLRSSSIYLENRVVFILPKN
jgi:hypothetical protein